MSYIPWHVMLALGSTQFMLIIQLSPENVAYFNNRQNWCPKTHNVSRVSIFSKHGRFQFFPHLLLPVHRAFQFGQSPDLRQRKIFRSRRLAAADEGQRRPRPHLHAVHHGPRHHGAVSQNQGTQVPQTRWFDASSREVCCDFQSPLKRLKIEWLPFTNHQIN